MQWLFPKLGGGRKKEKKKSASTQGSERSENCPKSVQVHYLGNLW